VFHSVADGIASPGHLRARAAACAACSSPWVDATTSIGEAMFHITFAWAGLEGRTLSERPRGGTERAPEGRGSKPGRPCQKPLAGDPRLSRSATWTWPERSPGSCAGGACTFATRRSSRPRGSDRSLRWTPSSSLAPLPYHLTHALDPLLWVVFLLGDVNFVAAGYFLWFLVTRRSSLAGPRPAPR
jgi:hypothetical protein